MAGYPLTWLADVLRGAGCRVVEESGWKTRGRDGSFTPRGIMLHHDASPAGETSNGVDVIRDGRPGLAGPLAQLWLAYDGTWHVVAAGRANHAGEGQWHECPRDQGNAYFIGIETDHTTNEQWTSGQRSAALAGVAALADRLGIRTPDGVEDWFCAHKEYTDRKPDPDPLDMDYAREQLLAYDGGDAPVQKIQKSTQTVRTLVNEEWRDLRFTDNEDDPTGVYAMCRGPLSFFELTVQVHAEAPAGTVFYLRPYKDGGPEDVDTFNHRSYEAHSNGRAFVDLAQGGNLASGKYLRVQGMSLGADVKLTLTRGQLAGW
jgi:N-acetylmuramoyl-L-alanine amidase